MNKILLFSGRFLLKKVFPSAMKIALGKLDGKTFDGSKRLIGAGITAIGIGMYVVPEIVPVLKPLQSWALDVTVLGGSTLAVGTAHWLTKKEGEIERKLPNTSQVEIV